MSLVTNGGGLVWTFLFLEFSALEIGEDDSQFDYDFFQWVVQALTIGL